MSYSVFPAHERTEKPSLTPRGMHSHNDYEIYCFLSGDVDFIVEGKSYPLSPGDIVLLRKGEVHIPRIHTAAPFERMHINFDLGDTLPPEETARLLSIFHDRPLGKQNLCPAALFPEKKSREAMARICTEEDPTLRLCALISLLGQLASVFPQFPEHPEAIGDEGISQVIRFVNENLSSPLSLEGLARRFYLSKTHLNRLFRRATGTTLWQYVTIKRLFLAKEMMDRGIRPTKAAADAGFAEYSAFFRAYKKHFGSSPREA